jgi:hypothetical protein
VGSQVIGDPSNTIRPSGNSDSSGSIRFAGSYSRLNFTAGPNYTGPEDGILVQLVTEPDGGTPGTTPIGTQVGRGECTDWALDRRPDLVPQGQRQRPDVDRPGPQCRVDGTRSGEAWERQRRGNPPVWSTA